MISDIKIPIKLIFFLIFVFIFGGYALFSARGLIAGPIVNLEEPENGQSFSGSLFKVKGKTKNVSFISLNDHSITTDEEGNFEEQALLAPGYNVIKVMVRDRFGREKTEFLELVYNLEK